MNTDTSRRNVRILIAEDEKIVAMDLSRRLQALGYSVVSVVGRGEDAVRDALEREPDAVLMDIHLGGSLDGVEAAKRIRDAGGPPVVFATAFSDRDTLARARTTLPFGYVLKPFQDDAIQATIEMALGRWDAEREIQRGAALLRSTMSAIGEAVITVDAELLVTFMNSAAEKITGWPFAEANGGAIWDVLDLYASDGRELQENLFTGEPAKPLQCLLRKRDGTSLAVTVQRLAPEGRETQPSATVFVIEKVASPRP